MSEPKRKSNAAVLSETLDLDGKRVVDVGCGDGAFTRLMTRLGAQVTGIECNTLQLEKAFEAAPAGAEAYKEGVGEALPLKDGAFDIVVFFNSLHHVPVGKQTDALAEAARVLKPGGQVYIAEPLAEGAHFDLMMPVHDETRVRAAAYDVIKACARQGLGGEKELFYVHAAKHDSFDAFREALVRINPDKAGDVAEKESLLRESFERLGVQTEDGYAFDQPMRVNLLRKAMG